MSTYTDLQNKVKETLNVDYHSRETNQRAVFLNPENEYFGKFHGKMDATNSSITGGVISGVTILSANLKEDIILPGNINITKIGKDISYISSAVDTLEDKHDYETEQLRHDISAEAWKRDYNDLSIVGTLLSVRDDILDDLGFEISARKFNDGQLSLDYTARISAEAKTRKETDDTLFSHVDALYANDGFLSASVQLSVKNINDAISLSVENLTLADEKLDAKIDAEAAQRIAEDKRLDDEIAELDAQSQARYLSAMEALSAHDEKNTEQFNDLSTTVDEKVEHDKHYVINNDGIVTKFPYQMKDFAVNVLEVDDVIGYVKHGDNVIGKLEKKTDAEYPMYLEIVDFDDPEIKQALIPNTFVFDESHGAHPTGCNNYVIQYCPSLTLSGSVFRLIPDNKPYLNVYAPYFDNQNIAKIRDYKLDIAENKVISGSIAVDTELTELTVFNKFGGRMFNTTDLSAISAETERIVYNGDNSFKFYKNITQHKYFPLIDKDGVPFAKVYEEGGILSNDSGIEQINVNVYDPLSTVASLNRADGYEATISTDTIMSCDIENKTFDIVHKNILYKYGFYLSNDTEFTGEMLGYVVPETPNHDIDESVFGVLSANIENVVFNPSFKKTYALKVNKSSPVKEWKASDVNDEGDTLDLNFNGTYLYVWTFKKETGAVTSRKYLVKKADPEIFNPDTCYEHLHTTNKTEFVFNEYEERSVKYDVLINTDRKQDENPEYTLAIDVESADSLTIQLPTKEFSDISRELNVVLKVTSTKDKLVKVNVVDYRGVPVKFFYNKHKELWVETNKHMTLQFKEVKPDTFLIVDSNDLELIHWIKELRREMGEISVALSTDYTERIDSLSTSVYTDMTAISTDLQNQILSNDADIEMLSGCVDDIYEKIKGGVTYKGVVNVIDKECEHGGSNFHISNLFYIDFGTSPEHHGYNPPDPTYREDTVLSSGFMYVAKKTSDNITTHWKVDGVEIEAGDWVILNFHDDKCKQIKDITSADVDVIDAMDDDLVTTAMLSVVSADLQNQILSNDADIDYLSTCTSSLSDEVYETSTFLSNNIDFLSATIDDIELDYNTKIEKLSTDLSNDIDALSASLSNTTELCVVELQEQIISNDNDIDFLSAKTSFLLSTDKEHVAYQGTLAKYVPEHPEIETNYRLSAFINNSLNPDFKGNLKLGFMFHLSAEQSCMYDIDGNKTFFGKNDFFIINKDVIVNDVRIADLDIIRDAQGEFEFLSADLIHKIDEVSCSLSTQIFDISTYLSNTIDAVSADLTTQVNDTSCSLSTQIFETSAFLSGNIDYLSAEISSNDNDISALFDITDSLDLSIRHLSNDVSAELSAIEYHYDKTFKKDVHIDVDESIGPDISVDMLKLTEETGSGKSYAMHLSAGTIVLMPIE